MRKPTPGSVTQSSALLLTRAGVQNPHSFHGVARQPTLSPEEAEHVRVALRRLAARYGTQTALQAAHPQLKQQNVSKILSGSTTPGWDFARKLARALRITTEALLSGGTSEPETPRFRDISNWDESAQAVITDDPDLEDFVRVVGGITMPEPIDKITVGGVRDLALFWQRAKRLGKRQS